MYSPLTTLCPGLYRRNNKLKSPLGTGSQLLSLSAPGEVCCRYIVSEPSAFFFRSRFLVPIEKRLIGLGSKKCSPSYADIDQNASAGGS